MTARLLFEEERFKDAAFYAQQVAEKAPKAVQIERLGRFDRIYDLVNLAQSVSATKDIIEGCADLAEYYIDTRYPVTRTISEEDAEEALGKREEVLEWAKSILK